MNQLKAFKEKEIQADHALITAMEFANEKMDIKNSEPIMVFRKI